MTNFEILRPWAFLFLIPMLFLCLFQGKILRMWQGVIDKRLVGALLVGKTADKGKSLVFSVLFIFSCVCAVIAMAGIQFREVDSSLYKQKKPVVLLMDLSLSMRAKDVSPNRFSTAVFKTYDLLKALNGMPVGLIVFTSEPYVIVPTTTDAGVVEKHMPLMNFNLLPTQGTVFFRAIDEAARLLKNTGAEKGDVFLLTDGGEGDEDLEERALQSARRLSRNGGRLFVLSIGTPQGAVLTDKNDAVIKDDLFQPVVHKMKEDFLKRLASAGKGAYASVSPSSNEDILFLMKAQKQTYVPTEATDYTNKTELDEGYWFILPFLILFPVFLLQGRLSCIIFLLCLSAAPARADFWDDWFTSDYDKIQKIVEAQEFDKARDAALATKNFKIIYNTGTAFIHKGKYKHAADTLTQAVRLNPKDENAAVNLEIAQRLLKQEQKGDGGDSGFGGKDGQNQEKKGETGDAPDGEREEFEADGDDKAEADENKNDTAKNESKKEGDNRDKNKKSEQTEKKDKHQQDGSDGGSDARQNKKSEENQEDKDNSSENNSKGNDRDGKEDSENSDAPDGQKTPPDNTLKRVREDPAALLKHKINTLYNSKRYQNDDVRDVRPW